MATLVKIQGNAVFNGGAKFQVTGVDTPLTPSLSSITSSGFTLQWDAVLSAINYQLDISTNSNFSSFVAGYNSTTVATTSALVTGLSPQTTYWARIRAVVASTNSASVSGTTLEATSTLTNGLLAFYKFSDLTDSSGNGNTLTNNNGVTFSSGKIGNAAVFDGSGNYLTSQAPLVASADFAGAAWIKINSTNNFAILENSFNGSHSSANFLFGRVDGQLRFGHHFTGWVNQYNFTPTLGQWYHVAISRSSGTVKMYLDGSEISSESYSSAFNGQGVTIGRLGGTADANGQIDAVGIWNRALTNAEITELYNAGNGLEIN